MGRMEGVGISDASRRVGRRHGMVKNYSATDPRAECVRVSEMKQ
jgi:hypothetical protein